MSGAHALQAALNATIAAGGSLFTLPTRADIFFGAAGPLIVSEATNLVIDGAGSSLWFGVSGGVLITQSTNVSLHNVTIDYEELPYLQMTAVGDAAPKGASQFTVNMRADLGSADPISFWSKYSTDPANEFVQGPQWWHPGVSGLYEAPPYNDAFTTFNATEQVVKTANESFVYTSPPLKFGALPRAGDKMTVVVRKGFTLHTHNSSRCRFVDVAIHSAPFMAVTEFDGKGGHVYERVIVGRRIVPDVHSRCAGGSRVCLAIVSSNADVFHSSGCRDGPRLTNASFSYALDDYFNCHSRAQVCRLPRSPWPSTAFHGLPRPSTASSHIWPRSTITLTATRAPRWSPRGSRAHPCSSSTRGCSEMTASPTTSHTAPWRLSPISSREIRSRSMRSPPS